MAADTKSFRESRLELLRFFGSPPEQVEWQARTPTLGIDEPMEWWLEDFHPDSELFRSAFTPQEIRLLKEFHTIFEGASLRWLNPPYPSVEVALKDPAWLKVVEAARKISTVLK